MCVAVYELLIGFLALELALPKEEILKHAFDARKAEVLNSLIINTTAKANDTTDILQTFR